MKRAQTFLLTLVLFSLGINAQVWTWDKVLPQHTAKFSFSEDPSGNIYCLQPGNMYAQVVPKLEKLDAVGNIIWQITFPLLLDIKSLAASADGGVYLAGRFSGTLTLFNSTCVSNGASDIWIAKFTSSGNFLWAKTIGSQYEDNIGEICVSASDLIVTGLAGGTLNIAGTSVPKNVVQDFFLARLNSQGVHQSVFFSNTVDTNNTYPASFGKECAADPAGNIYVMAEFHGKTYHLVDTFHVGNLYSYETDTKVIIKFNPQLAVQYVYTLTSCYWYCPKYHDLNVNANGEVYFVDIYSYGQSGNDQMFSKIRRLNPSGVPSNSFQPRPDKRNYIHDIDLDLCGNVVYTGYGRDYSNSYLNYYCMLTGSLDPALNPQWIKIDSICNKPRTGMAVATTTPNQLFVAGLFTDSLQLTNLLIDTNTYYQYSGYYGTLVNSATPLCAITTGMNELQETPALSLFPNPCTEAACITSLEVGADLYVYSDKGQLVLRRQVQESTEVLDTKDYSPGIYLIVSKEQGIRRTAKLIVERK